MASTSASASAVGLTERLGSYKHNVKKTVGYVNGHYLIKILVVLHVVVLVVVVLVGVVRGSSR